MYQPNSDYIISNKKAKIWRYMDFTKFIDLLENQTLFLTRSDKFLDPFEGTFPKINSLKRQEVYAGKIPENILINLTKFYDEQFKNTKKFTFINCWHLNEYESAGMWKVFLKSNEGIAIQSTVDKLIESLEHTPERVSIGEVQYLDYKKDWMNESNILFPYFHKRKSFDYEKEIRVVHQDLPTKDDILDLEAPPLHEMGFNIKIDINKLIENIYVSPDSPSWLFELTQKVIQRYNIHASVLQSELSEIP